MSATHTILSDVASTFTSTPAMSATHTIPSDVASTFTSTPAMSATHTIPSDVASTFTSTPAMSATHTIPSDIASTSKSIPATNHPVSTDIPIVSLSVAAAGDISQEEIPKSVTVKEFPIQETDPGPWNINDTNTVDYWISSGPSSCQNHDINLSNSHRVYKTAGVESMKTRYLSSNVFKREWLLYSPSQGRLYCFVCRLLSKKESRFATSGFNDWKHCSNVSIELENGEEHQKCMMAYLIRHKETGSVDSLLLEQHRSEQEYWHKVLTRVVYYLNNIAQSRNIGIVLTRVVYYLNNIKC